MYDLPDLRTTNFYIDTYYATEYHHYLKPRNHWQSLLFAQSSIHLNSLPNWHYIYDFNYWYNIEDIFLQIDFATTT
jgi:hypothetical protein